jgi:hypothetical protein
MNGEERFDHFISTIENWIKSVGIIEVKKDDEVENILNLGIDQIKSLDYNECCTYSYKLSVYAEYIDSLLSKQKIAMDWADDGIWYIISDKINNYGDKYTKWQEKYFRSIKENPLASQILKVKNSASARIKALEDKSQNIKKLSDILLTLSKRK